MNAKAVLIGVVLLVAIILGSLILYQVNQSGRYIKPRVVSLISPPEVKRQIVQYPINPNKTLEVEAEYLPEFSLDISDPKFEKILESSKDNVEDLVSVNISHTYRTANIDADIEVDQKKKMLMIGAKDLSKFKPGLYKVSITLRTLEGEVNLDQDFAWGVLAVNTKKSVYQPGDKVEIGIGVLDDSGTTQCLTGFNHLSTLTLSIKSPRGIEKKYDIDNGSIKDSGECGPTTVTNNADFQAEYNDAKMPGIYQIVVEATVKGEKRSITDYFKVDPNVDFDVERTSFPTRIYPFVIYPNTFKVRAKKDYTGEVVDIVPAFFKIKNVSGNARLEQVGDFTRIIWSVNMKAGSVKEFTYFIDFPHVSPEFYLIGPIKIGNFTESRQWQIASDAINSTSGLVSMEDNSGPNTWSRIWTGTTWSPLMPTPPTSMSTTPGDSRWFREVSSPKTGEKIVALIDNATNDPLMVFTWSGSSWSLDKNFTINSSSADVTRPFDVAYEDQSGDALFLYSDYSNAQLRYYKRVDGVWDSGTTAAAGTAAGTAYDVYKRWVRLQPQLGTDTILAGYLNNNERVGAMIWDGATNTFGDQFADNAGSITATSDEQAFDIAWETQSNTPMIFWGTTSNNLIYREFSSGSWQAETTAASGFTNDLDWVRAGADPISSSNNIAIAMQDGTTCRARFGIWTGSSMTVDGTVPTCASVSTNNLVDAAFENNTGQAMYVYISSATTNRFSWLTWTSGGGFTSATTEVGNTTNIEGVQLYADLNTTSMMLLYHDNSGSGDSHCQLWDREWDGSSWSSLRSSPVFGNLCASADNDTEPYGFGFDRNLEKQVAYRWFANSGLVSVSSAIGTQDDPALLTSANQQFRLRLLIYTPDTLGTSFRDYKLQYVDPGNGTCDSPSGGTPSSWTDVPTSGGSTISFYDNATPADGATLTANGSLDPTYLGLTVRNQTYEEANNFTNSVASIAGDELGMWDFSLIDNTPFDRISQTYCFRVARTSNVVLRIGLYPQISTASVDDVLIQGGTDINQGTAINNE